MSIYYYLEQLNEKKVKLNKLEYKKRFKSLMQALKDYVVGFESFIERYKEKILEDNLKKGVEDEK